MQKWLKPKRLNVLASDEAGVHQEWGELGNNPDCFENTATGTALAAPIKRASWFYPSARSKQWRNVVDDTRGGRLWQSGEASFLPDVQERMKWALRVRTRAPFCLCQGVGGRQRVFVPFGRYRPPHVCRGRSRILRCPLSPSRARRLLRQDSH